MNGNKLSVVIGALMAGLLSQGELLAESSPAVQDRATSLEAMTQQDMEANRVDAESLKSTAAWKNLKKFVAESELVFKGVIRNIQYKLSDPADDGKTKVPYTYITYDVQELIRGQFEGNQVVLRFIGGLDERTMRYMGASHVPNFDLGDEDILFVQGNTKSMSPLVQNDRGRFRVIGGKVYSNNGRAVTLNANGQLEYGKLHRLEQILTTTVYGSKGKMVMEHKINPDAVEYASDGLNARTLISKVRELGLQSEIPNQFVNADFNKAAHAPSMIAATPPQIKPQENVAPKEPQHEANNNIGEMPRQHRSEF